MPPNRALATRQLTRQKLQIARFRLTVRSGPASGTTCLSSGVELTVGSGEGNDLHLADPSVSRHHCTFLVVPGGVEVRDLGSTNGTYINGIRVTTAFVPTSATLALGQTTLRFESIDEPISEPLSRDDAFGPVVGHSAAMRRLFAILERVAPSDATILLEGETGSGKGIVAEAIHAASCRSGAPFVVVDCATIPAGLMESELFGHQRGAFTGAHDQRVGLFEQASGGTVFLDEIGELPLEMQPKLLRVLERRTIRRVGSSSQIPVDVRVVAATNRDLRREVNQGNMRSDLWYRLNTVRLVLPPLRERLEDVPLLVNHFYRTILGDESACPPTELVQTLSRRTWPGNVRELANAVERALVFSDNAEALRALAIDDGSSDGFDPKEPFRSAKVRATSRWERQYLIQLIGYHDGNISAAARAVRMDRTHLRSLLGRYRIPIPGRGLA
jgi:two-component system, NtrC family, response regulator GlrR